MMEASTRCFSLHAENFEGSPAGDLISLIMIWVGWGFVLLRLYPGFIEINVKGLDYFSQCGVSPTGYPEILNLLPGPSPGQIPALEHKLWFPSSILL